MQQVLHGRLVDALWQMRMLTDWMFIVVSSVSLQLINTISIAYTHIDWSSDGNYFVATDGTNIDFYSFDYINFKLVLLSRFTPGQSITTNVRWAHNSFNFIYGTFAAGVPTIASGLFNTTTNTASLVNTQPFNGVPLAPNYVDIAPTDDFIVAVGTIDNSAMPQNNVLVYPYVSGVIGTVVAQSVYGINSIALGPQTARAVSWSPVFFQDTIAVGGESVQFLTAPNVGDISLYQFNRTANTLTPGAKYLHDNNFASTASGFYSVDWSVDGKFIAAGGTLGSTVPVGQVFLFTLSAPTLTVFEFTTWQALEIVASVKFSPNNSLLAVDGGSGSVVAGKTLSLYATSIRSSIMQALNNAVINNLVYCTKGLTCNASGVGISADSNKNLIISNRSFNNDVNYTFVSNVYFNGGNGMPTLLQNTSIPPH